MSIVYIEKRVQEHPNSKLFLQRLKPQSVIEIDHYQEVFNRKKQDFRLQKQKPCWILAKKEQGFIQEIPKELTIGFSENYYFSPVLNCPFDCQYCFLQGMFRSAHYVVFVNYEDFIGEIEKKMRQSTQSLCFFSGYDADSLALESKTEWMQNILPAFERKKAYLEIRTKSIYIRPLLERKAQDNIIVAFSLNPDKIIQEIEHKTPSLDRRLKTIKNLIDTNWKIGLRFDPVIYCKDFESVYKDFFEKVFSYLDASAVHSITLGSFRLPKPYYQNMQKQQNTLLATIDENNSLCQYPVKDKKKLLSFCKKIITHHFDAKKLYCYEKIGSDYRD